MDERLVPILDRLSLLEQDERAIARQLASPATTDLPRLLTLSASYSGVQEGLSAQDEALITTLRSLLVASMDDGLAGRPPAQ
ncbi:MAG: hypothetical protein NVSMB65_22200 [Chloroflexota bacterium]